MRLGMRAWTTSVCIGLLLALGTLVSQADEQPNEVSLRAVTPKEFAAVIKASKGKVVLVDFWATTCLPCRKQFPHTIELQKRFNDQGLRVITMSCDDESEHQQALKFLTKTHANVTNLRSSLGASDDTYNAYQIDSGALPHYKLYDRAGKLRHVFGVDSTVKKQFTAEDIQTKIEELLEEK